MDSFVFLDDNPFERNLVREMLPEVTVPVIRNLNALRMGILISMTVKNCIAKIRKREMYEWD